MKSRGEKERYKHLNAEFQRRARRDKKAFLRDQCKEIEENNRMGKTRDLFKKIPDTKGIFHAKMSSIKDRNGTDLIEGNDTSASTDNFDIPTNHDGDKTESRSGGSMQRNRGKQQNGED